MAHAPFANNTAEFFYKLSLVAFLTGLPNFWIEELYISKKFTKIHRLCSKILSIFVYILVAFELGAFLTNQNLTKKQESDLLIFGISHPILWCYTVILSNKTPNIKKILFDKLELTKVFNDAAVEEQMVRKSKLYSLAFLSSCMLSMVMYTLDAFLQVIMNGATFTIVVTAWPDVENHSTPANLMRLAWNFLLWVLVIRVMGVYTFVFSLTTSLSHQFINLQKYFYSLEDIFHEKNVNQREAEMKYEEAFKVGIKFFNDTMNCVNQSKVICGNVYSGQIIFNTTLLVITMSQLLVSASSVTVLTVNSERTIMNTGAIALAISGILTGSALFMCNAGDVTIEASKLATAMYFSGWNSCQGQSSTNMRKLVVFSMMVAQQPVVIKGLGIIELSYQSYVSLVKSSYSLFSVLY